MKKMIMMFGACTWASAACGSSTPEDIEAYLRVLRQANQASCIEVMGGAATASWGRAQAPVDRMEFDNVHKLLVAGPLVGTHNLSSFNRFYSQLLPTMQEKWRALSAEVGRHFNAGYVCSQIAALEPEDVELLKSPQCPVGDVV
ncbi:MAG: hypothetical protein LCH26_08840, partial [Proteobacteria bacterium]|nr:hypothetical protein [Pseudomonadota bacterium]